MKLSPLFDRILVERIEEETKENGIIIPDAAKEKPQRGRVVEVGPGRQTEDGHILPMGVKVGDIVLFAEFSGKEIRANEQAYLIMSEHEILAKEEE